MSYLVLARRWRPQKFSDLVGQDVVVRTLKNALMSGNMAHAYLLCGIRGVGKTTIARLMAMAVNCQASDDGEPCGQCSACRSIVDGSNLDVQEMDAASHTGVDDVRDILDGVRYPPSTLKTKVYIIDEAHMLSKNAFNALLKTLEEPPAHVLFILATTESDKLPVTVRSRCQRFDLRRLGLGELRDYLQYVFKSESIQADDGAIMAIAQAADGSVRDALSLSERVLAYSREHLETADVMSALGLVGCALNRSISEAVFAADAAKAVLRLRDAMGRGHGGRSLMAELGRLWHQLACLQADSGLLEMEINAEHRQWLEQQAKRLTAQALDLRYQVLLQGIRDLSLVDERMGAEMVLMRLCGLNAISAIAAMPESAERAGLAVADQVAESDVKATAKPMPKAPVKAVKEPVAASVPVQSMRTKSMQTKSMPVQSMRTEAMQTEAMQTEAMQTEAMQTEAMQTEAVGQASHAHKPPSFKDIKETSVTQAPTNELIKPLTPAAEGSDDLLLDVNTVPNGKPFASWEVAVEAYGAIKPGMSAMLDHVICAEFGEKVRLGLNNHQAKMIAGSERLAFSEWLGREVLWESRQQHQGESLSQERAKLARAEEVRLRRGAESDPHVQALVREMDAKLVKVLPAGVSDSDEPAEK